MTLRKCVTLAHWKGCAVWIPNAGEYYLIDRSGKSFAPLRFDDLERLFVFLKEL